MFSLTPVPENPRNHLAEHQVPTTPCWLCWCMPSVGRGHGTCGIYRAGQVLCCRGGYEENGVFCPTITVKRSWERAHRRTG